MLGLSGNRPPIRSAVQMSRISLASEAQTGAVATDASVISRRPGAGDTLQSPPLQQRFPEGLVAQGCPPRAMAQGHGFAELGFDRVAVCPHCCCPFRLRGPRNRGHGRPCRSPHFQLNTDAACSTCAVRPLTSIMSTDRQRHQSRMASLAPLPADAAILVGVAGGAWDLRHSLQPASSPGYAMCSARQRESRSAGRIPDHEIVVRAFSRGARFCRGLA